MELIAKNRKLVEANTALAIQVKALVAKNALLAATQGAAATNKPHNATTKREQLPIDLSGYCLSHGYIVIQGCTSKTCGGKLQGHQEEVKLTNMLGRKMWYKPNDLLIGAVIVGNLNINEVNLLQDPSPPTKNQTGIADTGATGYFLQLTAPHNQYMSGAPPIVVSIPNGEAMRSTK